MPKRTTAREEFLDATAQLLRRQGYAATGLNEIVQCSGAPKGSLYYHFPDGKEQLAVEAMARAGHQLRDAIDTLTRGDDIGKALARLVDAMAAGLEASDFEQGCPIATVTLEATTTSATIRTVADTVFNSWLEVLEARLCASGMRPAQARRRATLVLSALEGALILARASGDLEPLHAVRDELVALAPRYERPPASSAPSAPEPTQKHK
jgi:TetR/AcrR family transcriptional repressor of lmrAB and yxaGH operons